MAQQEFLNQVRRMLRDPAIRRRLFGGA